MIKRSTEKKAYAEALPLSLGKVTELTFGSGEIEVDFLGNTQTYYGRWIGIAENESNPSDTSSDEAEKSEDSSSSKE